MLITVVALLNVVVATNVDVIVNIMIIFAVVAEVKPTYVVVVFVVASSWSSRVILSKQTSLPPTQQGLITFCFLVFFHFPAPFSSSPLIFTSCFSLFIVFQ